MRKGSRVTGIPGAFAQGIHEDINNLNPDDPDNTDLHLYNLSEVLKAKIVFIVQVRIASDCLNEVLRLAEKESSVATTVQGGQDTGGKFWKDNLKQYIEITKKKIRILPSNTKSGKVHAESGMEYAKAVAAAFFRVNPDANVKIVELPDLPMFGDFKDWYANYKKENEKIIASPAMEAFGEICKQAEAITPGDVKKWELFDDELFGDETDF